MSISLQPYGGVHGDQCYKILEYLFVGNIQTVYNAMLLCQLNVEWLVGCNMHLVLYCISCTIEHVYLATPESQP